MMWDYNIGLVRITHLFKALGYSKVCFCSIYDEVEDMINL